MIPVTNSQVGDDMTDVYTPPVANIKPGIYLYYGHVVLNNSFLIEGRPVYSFRLGEYVYTPRIISFNFAQHQQDLFFRQKYNCGDQKLLKSKDTVLVTKSVEGDKDDVTRIESLDNKKVYMIVGNTNDAYPFEKTYYQEINV